MAKKINTEETPQTDNNNIPAPEAQAVPVPETASENLGTGGETEDRLPAKTAGKGNAGSEETTEPHILSLLKKFPAYPSLYIDMEIGTSRCLLPFPSTRMNFSFRYKSDSLRLHSSETRSPQL